MFALKRQSVLFRLQSKSIDSVGSVNQLISDASFSTSASLFVVANFKMIRFGGRTFEGLHADLTDISIF